MSDEARYDTREADDGSFYYVLIAANGEILETSETYTREQDAERGIKAAKRAAAEANASD